MEQIAMVKSILDNGMAQVAVQRETACGAAHSCADCAGCEKMMTRTENVVVAYNDVNAHPGDVVKVQSENGNFFKTAPLSTCCPWSWPWCFTVWPRPCPWAERVCTPFARGLGLSWASLWPWPGTAT